MIHSLLQSLLVIIVSTTPYSLAFTSPFWRLIDVKLKHGISTNSEERDAYASEDVPRLSMQGVKSIGVDFGLVRTGVAVTIGYAPCALTVLTALNENEAASSIVDYCHRERAAQVVLGLPLHKNGTISEQANITIDFGHCLACACYAKFGPDFKVYLWDERYTSKEATARLLSTSGGRESSKAIDSEAACIILEHFYKTNGKGAIRINVPENMIMDCERAWELQKGNNRRSLAAIIEQRDENLNSRKALMERAEEQERQMAKDGTLGVRKKDKKKKKKRAAKWKEV